MSFKYIQIGNYRVGAEYPPFIIAEMSGNHNQSIDRAKEIIKAAAQTGVQAIKLQTYTPDTMTIPGVLKIEDKNSLWYGKELYELYQMAYTPWEWHKELFNYAHQLGLLIFSTPFDETAVDFLESLNVPVYKIASFENTDWPLLKKVAQTGKPVIMSTGAASLSQIAEAVDVLNSNGCKDLVLLKCTSTYPATPANSNILTIPHLERLYDCIAGLSDHTLGIGVSVGAVALGARVIEKHFTLRRADGGVDSAFSMEPEEMKALVEESNRVFQALGHIQYNIQESEKASLMYKRSIFVVKDVKKGERLTAENIRVIRPGYGLEPKFYDRVLNHAVTTDIKAGTPLSWDLI